MSLLVMMRATKNAIAAMDESVNTNCGFFSIFDRARKDSINPTITAKTKITPMKINALIHKDWCSGKMKLAISAPNIPNLKAFPS
jgi:hypothetical protein